MSRISKLPTTPEIEARDVSRQRKLQLRAKLAGICGLCIKRPISSFYPKGERCDECKKKEIAYSRKRNGSKKQLPWVIQPQKSIIFARMAELTEAELHDGDFLKNLAVELNCPVGYLSHIRRTLFKVKLKRGPKLGSKHKKHEKDPTETPISQEG